eukprot:scaffold2740_cov418-Prasinococcus_capsulatus_cf.AAC.25
MEEDEEQILEDAWNASEVALPSDAIRVLDELQVQGALTPEKSKMLQRSFGGLHELVKEVVARYVAVQKSTPNKLGKTLVHRVKGLAQAASTHEVTDPPYAMGANDVSVLDLLKDDAEQAETEATLCRERKDSLHREMHKLRSRRDECRRLVEDLAREQREAMAPHIRQIRHEIADILQETRGNRARLNAVREELRLARDQMAVTEKETLERNAIRRREQQRCLELAKSLEHTKRMIENSRAAYQNQQLQESRLQSKLTQANDRLSSKNMEAKALSAEHSEMGVTLQNALRAVNQRDRVADEIQKHIEMAGLEAEQYLADQVSIDMQLQVVAEEQRRESDALKKLTKEKDRLLRQYKKVEVGTNQVHSMHIVLKAALDQVQADLQYAREERCGREQVEKELRKELDSYVNQYLDEESSGEQQSLALQISHVEVEQLRKEVLALAGSVRARSTTISNLEAHRQRLASDGAQKRSRWRAALESVRVKGFTVQDLQKKCGETNRQLKDFSQLYTLVKNQRNTFVYHVKESSHRVAEMKGKLELLDEELVRLRDTMDLKEAELARRRKDHVAVSARRDHLQTQLNKFRSELCQRNHKLDERRAQSAHMQCIVQSIRLDMSNLTARSEEALDSRNRTGKILLERNDEVVVLHRKCNAYEEVLRMSAVTILSRFAASSRMLLRRR